MCICNETEHKVINTCAPKGKARTEWPLLFEQSDDVMPVICLQPSMTQYRNSVSDAGCQSPTSPHSAPSYSPAQSPGLPSSAINNSPFAEAYYLQQHQQQTSALQHQFEQFNMVIHQSLLKTHSRHLGTANMNINH